MVTNLFPELAGNLASGVGSALGGFLGQVGSVLSAPRRALWSALGAPETGQEVVTNLGGDPDSFLTKALGVGLEIAGDPLTFAFGPIIRGLGGMANRGLSRSAWAAGPGYSDDISKFTSPVANTPGARESVNKLLRQTDSVEQMQALAREAPEGLKYLGHGSYGVAYETPTGGVVRLGTRTVPDMRNSIPTELLGKQRIPSSRPDSPLVLQAARDATAGPLRIEHTPLVTTFDNLERPLAQRLQQEMMKPRAARDPATVQMLQTQLARVEDPFVGAAGQLSRAAEKAGMDPWDLHLGNLAKTSEGKWLTHDPGAIIPATGPIAERGLDLLSQQPGKLSSFFARLLGGQGRVRDYLARQTSTGGAGQGIDLVF